MLTPSCALRDSTRRACDRAPASPGASRCSGTTIWLWTWPASRPSRIQSRWFGDTRNIVEHRHPNGSSVTTVRSGATSCASRLTRWTSVATAHTVPTGLALTVVDDLSRSIRCRRPPGRRRTCTPGARSPCRRGYCFRNASICATVKRVWTEQCPFHRISFALRDLLRRQPAPSSFGSHTTMRSSGTPIL